MNHEEYEIVGYRQPVNFKGRITKKIGEGKSGKWRNITKLEKTILWLIGGLKYVVVLLIALAYFGGWTQVTYFWDGLKPQAPEVGRNVDRNQMLNRHNKQWKLILHDKQSFFVKSVSTTYKFDL